MLTPLLPNTQNLSLFLICDCPQSHHTHTHTHTEMFMHIVTSSMEKHNSKSSGKYCFFSMFMCLFVCYFYYSTYNHMQQFFKRLSCATRRNTNSDMVKRRQNYLNKKPVSFRTISLKFFLFLGSRQNAKFEII